MSRNFENLSVSNSSARQTFLPGRIVTSVVPLRAIISSWNLAAWIVREPPNEISINLKIFLNSLSRHSSKNEQFFGDLFVEGFFSKELND